MKFGRRSFLQVLGVAPAIAATAPAEVLGAAGVRGRFATLLPGLSGAWASGSAEPLRTAAAMSAAGLTSPGQRIDDPAAWLPFGLDPDLVVNRSFSLAAKMLLQRRRDRERMLSNPAGDAGPRA